MYFITTKIYIHIINYMNILIALEARVTIPFSLTIIFFQLLFIYLYYVYILENIQIYIVRLP